MQKDVYLVVEGVEEVDVTGVCVGPSGFELLAGRFGGFPCGEFKKNFLVVGARHPDSLGCCFTTVAGVIGVADVAFIASAANKAPPFVKMWDDVLRKLLLPIRDFVVGFYKRDKLGAKVEKHDVAWLWLIGLNIYKDGKINCFLNLY